MRLVSNFGLIRDALGVSHGDPDLVLVKAGLEEVGDGLVGVAAVFENTNDDGTLLQGGHDLLPVLRVVY